MVGRNILLNKPESQIQQHQRSAMEMQRGRRMGRGGLAGLALLAALVLGPGGALAAITYDDGAVHTLGSDLNDNNLTIGVNTTGTTFNQSAYTYNLSNTLLLAQNAGSSGFYNLSGGTLTAGRYLSAFRAAAPSPRPAAAIRRTIGSF
jgi:hypothetical protein